MSFREKFKSAYVRHYQTDHPLLVPLYMVAVAVGGWNAGMSVREIPDVVPTTASAQQVENETAQIKRQLADIMASKEAADAPVTEIVTLKRNIDRGIDADASKIKLDALRLDQAKKTMVLEDKVDAAMNKILLSSTMPEAQLSSVLHDFNQTTYKVAKPEYITRLEQAATWRDECRLQLNTSDTAALSNNEKTAKVQFCAGTSESNDGATMLAAAAGGAIVSLSSMFLLMGVGGTSLRRRWSKQQSDARYQAALAEMKQRERHAPPPIPKPVVKKTDTFNLD